MSYASGGDVGFVKGTASGVNNVPCLSVANKKQIFFIACNKRSGIN